MIPPILVEVKVCSKSVCSRWPSCKVCLTQSPGANLPFSNAPLDLNVLLFHRNRSLHSKAGDLEEQQGVEPEGGFIVPGLEEANKQIN